MGAGRETLDIEPFKQLGVEARKLLDRGLSIVNVAPAAKILRKGEAVSGAYVVLKGRLRVYTIAPNGVEATVYFIDPGEACVLALNCLFKNLLYPAWVQAEVATSVAIIAGATYRKLFESEASIQNLTVQGLSTLVFRLMGELEQIHGRNYRQRLAQFILMHANAEGSLAMTQQRIAQHLGTTREVIARLMGEFVAERLLRTRRGSTIILSVDGLRRIIAS
jgi:CRP/FNR family transcriptional regulator